MGVASTIPVAPVCVFGAQIRRWAPDPDRFAQFVRIRGPFPDLRHTGPRDLDFPHPVQQPG